MNDERRLETRDPEREFLSKNRSIRSKNLRKFLELYYLTHIATVQGNKLSFKWIRQPRIRPGLHFIQRYLSCSKRTAQDYLRAIQITHDILLKREIERRGFHTRVDSLQYDKLLRGVAYEFDRLAKMLGVRRKNLAGQLQDIRLCLQGIADDIEQSSGVFTPEDCANIIRELASVFY